MFCFGSVPDCEGGLISCKAFNCEKFLLWNFGSDCLVNLLQPAPDAANCFLILQMRMHIEREVFIVCYLAPGVDVVTHIAEVRIFLCNTHIYLGQYL